MNPGSGLARAGFGRGTNAPRRYFRGCYRQSTSQRVRPRYILALTCDYLDVHDTRPRVRGADRPHVGRTPGGCPNPALAAGRGRADPAICYAVAQGLIDLLGEIDETFSSDMWAILDSGRQHTTWLLYDGAALRHCCRLLYEIEAAAAAGLELSVRMLGRAHMEAWLVALFIHFGGYEALLKVAQDARHSLEGIELEARQFDEWLAAEKTAARKSGMRVAKTNSGIAQWNEKNPDVPPKPLLDEPYVPQLSSTGLDLSSLIEGFGSHEAQGLSVSEIVDALTKRGLGRASAVRASGPFTSYTGRCLPPGRMRACASSTRTSCPAASSGLPRCRSTARQATASALAERWTHKTWRNLYLCQ